MQRVAKGGHSQNSYLLMSSILIKRIVKSAREAAHVDRAWVVTLLVLAIVSHVFMTKVLYIRSNLLNSDSRRATAQILPASITLRSHDHVLVTTKLHTYLRPFTEVPPRCNGSACALLRSDAPILLKSACSVDGRLVRAGTLVKLVCSFLEGKIALQRPRFAGRQVAVGLNDVVLDQGVACPSVNGEISWSSGFICAAVLDCPVDLVSCTVISRYVLRVPCRSHLDPPGFHPLPHTKPPPPLHLAVYEPPPPLLQL